MAVSFWGWLNYQRVCCTIANRKPRVQDSRLYMILLYLECIYDQHVVVCLPFFLMTNIKCAAKVRNVFETAKCLREKFAKKMQTANS